MLSPNNQKKLLHILPFGFLFFLSSVVSLLIETAVLTPDMPVPAAAIDPTPAINAFAVLMMVAIGLLVGYLELYVIDGLFARQTLLKKVVYKFGLYLLLMHALIVLIYPVAAAMELGASPLSRVVMNKLGIYLISLTHFSTCLQLGVTIALAVFYAQIGQHMGHATLLSFLTGRYHRPREEARIFLFADMTSSTTIAERLGHLLYFDLLKTYYDDLSRSIARHAGEIHEYVGDEVVVSWPYREGVHGDSCLRCFYAMRDDLAGRSDYYLRRFGVVPTFKAALHGGRVTTGEIGRTKKQIIFTGDVLNATARMLALCGTYRTKLLLSGDLLGKLSEAVRQRALPLEERRLRGKADAVMLYTLPELGTDAKRGAAAESHSVGVS